MPTTPQRGLPYPASSDPPNGAAQIQSLAMALDSTPFARLVRTTSQSIPTGATPTRVTFPDIHDAVTFTLPGGATPTGVTVPNDGMYLLHAYVVMPSLSEITIRGAGVDLSSRKPAGIAADTIGLFIPVWAGGQTFELFVAHNAGSAQNLTFASFTAARIG